MSDEKLSPKARAALLVLMAGGGRMSNNEMEEIARFRLDGKERGALNRMGFVTTDETVRPFAHELTNEGAARCAEELRAAPPAPRMGSPLVGALYAVLGGLDRYLRRNGGDLSAIFGAGPDDVESLVRDTYRSLVREPGGWVSLADLRDKLAGVPAAAVDAALKQLVRQPDVILIPETDQSSLNARDREAAVRIGGEFKHLLAIEGR